MPTMTAEQIFAGPGEVRALCRAHDWAATPLGPVDAWPVSLRATVQLVMSAGVPMVMFWGPELVQIFNDAFRPSLGEAADVDGALGAAGATFWAEVWPARGPQIAHVLAGGAAVQHGDTLIPMTRNGRREDVWWSYSDSPLFDDDGRICGVLVSCQETTARTLLARRLTYVFQHAPSFLAVMRGPEYVFEHVNDAYYQVVGHRELLGKPVLEALPEVREQGFVQRLLDQVRESGEPYVGRETSILLARTPGAPPEERFIDFVYLPLIEDNGECDGVIAHGTDVTEQVRARCEVERLLGESERARLEAERARADAEAANRAKSEFLAVMSHELRTPLNAIGGYADLLTMGLRGVLTDPQRHDLERIRRANQHLMSLVTDILNFTRLDAGQIEFRLADCELAPIVADLEPLMQPQFEARGIAFDRDGCAPERPDRPHVVRADPEKLRQILLNLLGNAVKFTEAGGRVSLACETDAMVGRVRVSDTGRGIPPDQLERIFEPFVQVDRHRTHESQLGVGLGLAISRDLARGMGGDLTVESEEGRGSTFTITLPRARER